MNVTELSYKQQWIESIEKRRHDLQQVLELIDPFENWETGDVPTITIGEDLRIALEILFADTHPALAAKFLDCAAAQIERTELDNKFSQIEGEIQYPLTRAEFLTYKYFVSALRGKPLDPSMLYDAADGYLSWISEKKPPNWHDQDQAWFLAAIAGLLIAGDATQAVGLFERNQGVPWCRSEAQMWFELCQSAAVGAPPSEPLAKRLRCGFDVVRNPDFHPDYFSRTAEFRLEFGAIMWKYLEHPDAAEIDWNGVIELISR